MTNYTNAPLTKYQRVMLERMSTTAFQSATELCVGRDDPRGVGASMRALADRGLVEIGNRGRQRVYRKRVVRVRPRQMAQRWFIDCPVHGRHRHYELSADRRGHYVWGSNRDRVCYEPLRIVAVDVGTADGTPRPDYIEPPGSIAAPPPPVDVSLRDLRPGDVLELGDDRAVTVASRVTVRGDGTHHVVVEDPVCPGVSGDRYLDPDAYTIARVGDRRFRLAHA